MTQMTAYFQRWRERLEWSKLRAAVRTLHTAPQSDLSDVEFIARTIRRAGLVRDPRSLYGVDNRFMNSGPFGLWQIPTQLAPCLIELSRYKIATMIEIGTWSGWTVNFMGAYLRRFNPALQITTVDTGNCWGLARRPAIPMRVHQGTSADFRTQRFDFAVIDGDHAYHSCLADYENIGRSATICMFHDIDDKFVANYAPNEGGVPRLWAEMKSSPARGARMFEYCHHSQGDRVMGIGLIVRVDATGLLRP